MKVLVTGHLGYIGPIIVSELKIRGHSVTGLDIGYFRACMPPDVEVVAPDREIVKDIRDVQAGDVEGHDAIIHLSALSNDPMGELNPGLTSDINYQATIKLASLARDLGVDRFVFASSCSIYGAAGHAAALDETAAFNPVSAYAASKVASEKALRGLADDFFCPVFLRNATAYGLAPRVRFDLVFNNLMAAAHTTGLVKVLSDGSPWRPLVHVADIAGAAIAATEANREVVWNEAFNIGRADANFQVKDIANVVARAVPGSRIEMNSENGGDPRSYQVNFNKALTSLPGFAPSWTLERSADEFNEWFGRNGPAGNPVFSRMFIRLKQLKALLDLQQLDEDLRVVGNPGRTCPNGSVAN